MNRSLISLENELEIVPKKDCSAEENVRFTQLYKQGKELPEGVIPYIDKKTGEAYRDDNDKDVILFFRRDELSESERIEFVAIQTLKAVRTIKGCVIFFTILTVLNIIAALALGGKIGFLF